MAKEKIDEGLIGNEKIEQEGWKPDAATGD